jgi:hypothetical protein
LPGARASPDARDGAPIYAEDVSGVQVSFSRRRAKLDVFGLVQFPLIGLKLAGVITWPWSMVLLPLWFALGILFIVALGIGVVFAGRGATQLMEHWKRD